MLGKEMAGRAIRLFQWFWTEVISIQPRIIRVRRETVVREKMTLWY